MSTIALNVPDTIIDDITNLEEVKRELLEGYVAWLYQHQKTTLRQGAEMLGVHYGEFMTFLGRRNISFCNATPSEHEQSRNPLNNYLQAHGK